ncbi:hypothetical protein C8F04DRAFT_1367708 [Mycena alexandri]|uniref:Uncharacterized protein n=1 Tax=Mycena alexandri TaxID=1745969 RepID=A0AAD6SLX8_9AGAR|nr:hypothetical protein C8F04DRAFT_1367708 [Mycena alexandri]
MSATSTPDPQANASGNSNSKEDLNEGQDDIVVLTPDAATLEKALAERAQKRLAIAERKRGEAGEKLAFGVTQMQEKNYDAAATAFGEACALWRANPVAHCDLATAYLHLGRFDDAESSASTALGLDPKLVEARYTRAMARKGRGSVRGAIVVLDRTSTSVATHVLPALVSLPVLPVVTFFPATSTRRPHAALAGNCFYFILSRIFGTPPEPECGAGLCGHTQCRMEWLVLLAVLEFISGTVVV